MYNPFDENSTTNNAKDNEPLEQDTAKEEEPVNASQPETPASPEYHYTGSEVKDGPPASSRPRTPLLAMASSPALTAGRGSRARTPPRPDGSMATSPRRPIPTPGTASRAMSLRTRRSSPSPRSTGTAKRPRRWLYGWWQRCCAARWFPSPAWAFSRP